MDLKLSPSTYNLSVSMGTVAVAAAIAVLALVRGSVVGTTGTNAALSTEATNSGFATLLLPIIVVLALLCILAPFSWATCAVLLALLIMLLVNDYNQKTTGWAGQHATPHNAFVIDWINVALGILLFVLAWFVQ